MWKHLLPLCAELPFVIFVHIQNISNSNLNSNTIVLEPESIIRYLLIVDEEDPQNTKTIQTIVIVFDYLSECDDITLLLKKSRL